ncbi:hypothetical protein F511_32445 [Dorcoceras hygrometricum]|uniref:Uncharacterized protein n=1 Tax=Dorcoceras hygrometricum TaxID=472368 RepID=A0A2Z7BTK0_9LAMI|nr:hypothetical protein F511_32445 [Dorcoceras hygrometricum]
MGWFIGEEKVARPPGQSKVRTEVAWCGPAGPGGGLAGGALAMVGRSTAIVGREAAVVRRMGSVCGVCTMLRVPLHGPAEHAGSLGSLGLNGAGETADEFIPTGDIRHDVNMADVSTYMSAVNRAYRFERGRKDMRDAFQRKRSQQPRPQGQQRLQQQEAMPIDLEGSRSAGSAVRSIQDLAWLDLESAVTTEIHGIFLGISLGGTDHRSCFCDAGRGCRSGHDITHRILVLEDERVTPIYLISLMGSFSQYERSGCSPYWGLTPRSSGAGCLVCLCVLSGYHGFTAGRGVDPAGSAPGGG